MFVKDTDLVSIRVYYKRIGDTGHKYAAFSSDELGEEEKRTGDFSTLNVKMAELTWGLYNELQDGAMVEYELPNGETERRFNYRKFKEGKLKRLLKEWDACETVNGEPKPVPIDDQNVSHLAPQIAESILSAYDAASYLTEETEKN